MIIIFKINFGIRIRKKEKRLVLRLSEKIY